MTIERSRLCLNRRIAPMLPLEDFFQVAQRCGINKVEIRNDLPNRELLDGMTVEAFNRLTRQYQIEVLTINGLYPFNLPTARDNLTRKAKEQLAIAKAIHCQAIVMCPFNETDSRGIGQREADSVDSLRYFSELFAGYGIKGLIEPLGFPQSSLRSYHVAAHLLNKANSPFQIVMDTFHHRLAGYPLENYADTVDVEMLGLVHLSGVEDARDWALLTDEERIMLSPNDRLQSKEQVVALEALGYRGVYSFEPFSATLAAWSVDDVERSINESIDYLNA